MDKMYKTYLFVLFIIFSSFLGKAQNNYEFYKTPNQYPQEFNKISSEYLKWYNINKGVVEYEFSSIDNNVLCVIKNNPNIQDINLLVDILSKFCKNDLEKARAYYIWIVNSITYDVKIRDNFSTSIINSENRDDDALFCFKNRKGACVEISSIFYMMCKKGNVRAFTIGGFVKQGVLSENGYDEIGHAWSAFKYENNYFFLDATFGLQTKIKNELYKNTHFIINSEMYKYLYSPHDIYTKLSYSFDGSVYSNEKDWRLFSKEYLNVNRLNDKDWVEFNNILLLSNDVFKIKNHTEWLKFPVFGYEYYKISNIQKAEVFTNTIDENVTCSVSSFSLKKEKEYNKLSTKDRASYNNSAEEYLSYWVSYYKDKADNNKSNPELYQNYLKLSKKYEYDFTYFKLFKK